MKYSVWRITIFAILLTFAVLTSKCSCNTVIRARVESCPSCSLNRLPEVKKFIFDDLPKYENVEFKRIQGAPPELVLLGEEDEELDRIPLKQFNREQCNDLLKSKGFVLKSDTNTKDVPEFETNTKEL